MIFFHSAKSDYRMIKNPNVTELGKKYASAWQNDQIPARQLKVTEKQWPQLEKTPAIADLIEMIRRTKLINPKLLEIGCSTGYHQEAFRRAGLKVVYEGCDYSAVFIDLAKQLHPKVKFKVSDALKLDYASKAFDIVISGCCLLHIINFKKAVSETARTAKKYVIFHRTPVIHERETTYTKKTGYGVEMVEILFNEDELFRENGMAIIGIKTHGRFEVPGLGEPVFMKNYLCRVA